MKIYLDYDSTLVNFDKAYTQTINERYGTSYTSKDLVTWDFIQEKHGKESEVWKETGFYDKVVPITGALDFVGSLQYNFGINNIFIITASSPQSIPEKDSHIHKWFKILDDNIIHTNTKFKYTQDGILIDDYIKHICAHIEFNQQPGILFNLNKSYGWCPDEIENKPEQLSICHTYCEILETLNAS